MPADSPPPRLRPPVLVIQPLPGIGDMVWHLPHIRAVAAHAGTPVTLLAKPRALAPQLLSDEPAVGAHLALDLNPVNRRGVHDGPAGLVRLVHLLRAGQFGSAVLLHHSATIAAATMLAGIPQRLGYGWGGQRIFLNTGCFLPASIGRLHQHTRATRYLAALGIPLASSEPVLSVSPEARADARRQYGRCFLAIGIGSSEPLRQWGADRFAALASALLDAGWPTIVLLGGPEDADAATAIRAALGPRAALAQPVLGAHLRLVTGLLAEAAFYVGNNTGVMNMAAAVGTRTYALFGTTAPFHHATQIVAITAPEIGAHDGMVRLTVDAVLAAIVGDRGDLGPTVATAETDAPPA